jgi:glutathione S-transferase
MISTRQLIHTAFLFVLPIIVAWFGLSAWSALGLVIAALLWRWLIVLSRFVVRDQHPAIVLETIAASHFAEKARWSLDRLGVEYTELHSGGIIGVMFTGRTVPRLNFRTGLVRSSLGNSAEILRYLWGQYGARLDTAAFLEPTKERLELEKKIDRCGLYLQQWIYYHLLLDKELTLRLWGANNADTPGWQRALMRLLFPLSAAYLRYALAISEERYASAAEHIEALLSEVDTLLADGRRSILGGDEVNYVDITFAAIMGLWRQPANYGGGAADAVRVPANQLPAPMRVDVERWTDDYPRANDFIVRLFAEERMK